jgi:multiple sugar transport system permease protein
MRRSRSGLVAKVIAIGLFIAVLLFVFDFPIINTGFTSFKTKADISSRPPKWSFDPTTEHYENVLFAYGYDFPRYFVNSIVISGGASILTAFVCLLGAYSLVRFKVGGGNPLFMISSLRLVPPIVFLVPMVIIYRYFHLYDTRLGLVFAHTIINIPLALLLLVGFIQDVPKELEEAAQIDGASPLSVLWRIVFPLTFPGLAATILLVFVLSWNEFFMSLTLSMTKATPVTVGASLFVTAWEIKWGEIASAINISVLPTLIFTFVIQRYLVRAFTAGALK